MTTRKPKPVRAWAILDEKGRLSPVIVSSERRFLRELCFSDRGDYIARVTIAPDGTPSQDAEVRRLRRALHAVRRLCRECVIENIHSARMTFLVTQIDAALARGRGR